MVLHVWLFAALFCCLLVAKCVAKCCAIDNLFVREGCSVVCESRFKCFIVHFSQIDASRCMYKFYTVVSDIKLAILSNCCKKIVTLQHGDQTSCFNQPDSTLNRTKACQDSEANAEIPVPTRRQDPPIISVNLHPNFFTKMEGSGAGKQNIVVLQRPAAPWITQLHPNTAGYWATR